MPHLPSSQRVSFCFVSETGKADRPLQDPSVRYRCYHPAEMLVELGHICSIYSAAKFYEKPSIDYDVYVFHRPNIARSGFMEIFTALKRLNRTLIADYDDLIFGDEEVALSSSSVKNGTLTPDRAISAFSSNLEALKEFSFVATSTQPLLEEARNQNPNAKMALLPNIVPSSLISLHSRFGTPYTSRPSSLIGYFAGTRSHDKDFPIAELPLYRVLSENRKLHLLVVGPVALPRSLAALPNVTLAPVVNYLRLPSLMVKCAAVIAPLEDSRFNKCKSRVKFLEAALSGCSLIASPIPDMMAVGNARLNFASNFNDWYEALVEVGSSQYSVEAARSNFEFIRQSSNVDSLLVLGGLK